MEKLFLFILIITILVCLSACNYHRTTAHLGNNSSLGLESNHNTANNVKLIINNRYLPTDNNLSINYQEKYAQLPLITIAKSLGCDVNWYSKNKVKITLDNDIYILNPAQKTLFMEGDTFNIISIPPGSKHSGYFQIEKNEVFIDSDSLRHFISLLGATITIDYDSGIIKIDNKTT